MKIDEFTTIFYGSRTGLANRLLYMQNRAAACWGKLVNSISISFGY